MSQGAWPISISEACRRLKIPFNTGSVIIRSHEIPTVPMLYNGKGLSQSDFRELKRLAARCSAPAELLSA